MGDMTKEKIHTKLVNEILDTQSELNGGGGYQRRGFLSGKIEGLQYAKLLVSKLKTEGSHD